MDTIIEFLLNNYVWLIIVILILVFALIGYIVDTKDKSRDAGVKPITNVEEKVERKIHPSVAMYANEDFDEPIIKE